MWVLRVLYFHVSITKVRNHSRNSHLIPFPANTYLFFVTVDGFSRKSHKVTRSTERFFSLTLQSYLNARIERCWKLWVVLAHAKIQQNKTHKNLNEHNKTYFLWRNVPVSPALGLWRRRTRSSRSLSSAL